MSRASPAVLLMGLLALPACMNEYHPEYHPETVYQYVQTIKVEDPHPPPPPAPPVVVIVQSPPPPSPPLSVGPPPVASAHVSRRARAPRASLARREGDAPGLAADGGAPRAGSFQAAPVFAADDRAQ